MDTELETLGTHWRAILKIARERYSIFVDVGDTPASRQVSDACIAIGLSGYFAQAARLETDPGAQHHLQDLSRLCNVIGASARLPDEVPPCTE